ncbi:MAG: Histidine-tRNA ligase [Parcubacteria group bacterium GW2011_GWB1_41_6]|nr:MAG: Histidine-tRNA ligase [Parcubacteria group bacterium GW2011_GWB1_41_6]
MSAKEIIKAPKGMHDILPEDWPIFQWVFNKAEEIASFYGFLPIQTPHLERSDLFTRTVGESTDIIEKQMFALKSRGSEQLVLRPEETAPLMRAYLEHGLHIRPQPVMLFAKGSFFRYEQPQKGRFREFHQVDLEVIGDEDAVNDVLVIKTFTVLLEELGLKSTTVFLNTIGDPECRSAYRKELLAYYRKKINYLCKDCRRRLKTNPLRLLDCKEPGCLELKRSAPQMIDHLCPGCKKHFKEVLEYLDANNTAYIIDHYLVRGLDYYSRTVFEIFFQEEKAAGEVEEPLNASFSLLGGGRYDYLGDTLAGRHIPAVGAAMGVERIVSLIKEKNLFVKKEKPPKAALIQIGTAAKSRAISLIEEFRQAKIPLLHSVSRENLKNQLDLANKMNIAYALILGHKEALDNTIMVRDMNSGSQELILQEKLIDYIKKNCDYK